MYWILEHYATKGTRKGGQQKKLRKFEGKKSKKNKLGEFAFH